MERVKTTLWIATAAALLMAPMALASNSDASASDNPTFYDDVLPILQQNCQNCHRPDGANAAGMIAPMSFMNYEEARPWARSIAKAVQSRYMPPWGATPEFHGVFKNERTLTDAEIETIVKWAKTGATPGDPANAPTPIEFTSHDGWNMGEPDLVVPFDEPFWVADEVEDLYQNIMVTLTEDMLPEDKWIASIEFKPGSDVVHHIIGYAVAPGEGGVPGTRGMIGGNAPGKENDIFPPGYGIKLKQGSTVVFQMHYHKEAGPGTGTFDRSEMGIRFADKPPEHPVTITNISYHAFEIPPQTDRWRVGASKTFEEDTHLISLMPHMHLRGSYAKYTAFYPDGSTEVLLEVPEYDFNWQLSYNYADVKLIPEGTRIEMEMWFDNSEEQAAKGNFDPNRAIKFGGPTTDEMDLAWITIAPAQPVSTAAPATATGAGGR